MPVFQLIYRSKANFYLTDDDLIALLRQARDNNAQRNITGLLLYGYGSFTQILEGAKKDVNDLYFKRIAEDKRHRNPVVLHEGFAQKRLFKDWSMAFQPLDSERLRDLKGYLEPQKKPGDGRNLLASLRLLELMQGFSLSIQHR